MRELAPEQKQAGGAALALIVSLFLPWYQKNVADEGQLVSGNLNAFSVFSFVEAAIALVAVAVLGLLWARAQRRGFHLPGGDGTVIMAGGLWALFLLVWRLFDRPDVTGAAGANVVAVMPVVTPLAKAQRTARSSSAPSCGTSVKGCGPSTEGEPATRYCVRTASMRVTCSAAPNVVSDRPVSTPVPSVQVAATACSPEVSANVRAPTAQAGGMPCGGAPISSVHGGRGCGARTSAR